MKTRLIHLIVAFTCCSLKLHAGIPTYLEEAFRTVRWIAYSPTGPSPDLGSADSKEADKKREEIRKDLQVLKGAGFGGIVTYGCDGLKEEIPQLAHEIGIKHVIVGVYNPQNEAEMKNAKAVASLVDGYCVGNEGLGSENRYSFEELKARINELRTWTGKPVTTSEQIEKYLDGKIPGLIELGDWIFPNVHPWFHRQFKEPEASRWTKEQVDKLQAKAGQKIVLCKEVGFPTEGDDQGRANEDVQASYYVALRGLQVPFVYFEAFDQEWKTNLPIETHWGLFTKTRIPKKIVAMITGEHALNTIQFTNPGLGEKLLCTLGPDGGFFQLRGTAHGIDNTRTLLLFVDPQDPGTYGWFLQLDPNGVDLNEDGTWIARGQIGNRDYPPKNGMKIGLMVRAVLKEDANTLVEARKQDPRLSNEGIRPQNLPKADPEWIAELKDVELEIK